jgi:hypothetical protein
MNQKVGQDAGIFFQGEDRRWAELNVSIPVAFCANTGTLAGVPASQSRLTDFLRAWYMEPLERASPFNESMLINVVVTDNLWVGMFNSTAYMLAFNVIIPGLFFHVTFLSLLFAKERFVKVYRASRGSLGSALKTSLTPPFLALIVEALSTFFLGTFYAVDGMWANPGNSMAGLRALFMGM